MSDTNVIFTQKLSAFLHDPIDKPFILMQGESHVKRAEYLASLLQITLEKSEGPDWIASAMERVLLPKGSGTVKSLQVKFLDNPEIKHPLSGKALDCRPIKTDSLEIIKEIVNHSVEELATLDSERQFLNLWRNFIETLRKNSPEGISKYWSVIPADTRIPDHSIFEHLKITSACYNAMADRENKLLLHDLAFLLFTVGPVQSFIATARKLQDLWMGSFILSYLIWTGIKTIVETCGPDSIVFPDVFGQPLTDHWLKNEKGITPMNHQLKNIDLPSFPNRFLAIVPASEANELAKKAEESVKQTWMTTGLKSIQHIKMSKKIDICADQCFQKQMSNFLNVYWVAVPWAKETDAQKVVKMLLPYFSNEKIIQYEKRLQFFKNKGEYPPNIGTIYDLLCTFTEKALGARKNIRNFSQLKEQGIKCSLCGERNAFRDLSRKIRQKQMGLMGETESLCAVCLSKRLGKYAFKEIFSDELENEFPSIAEVATADFKFHLLSDDERKKAFDSYVTDCRKLFGQEAHQTNLLPRISDKTGFKGINIGGEYFFEEYLSEENLKKSRPEQRVTEHDRKELNDLREKLKSLYKLSNKPTPYYAVIRLDGDDMGKWLKGDNAPAVDKIFHSQVWDHLPPQYKQELKDICKDNKRPMSPAIHSAIGAALRDYSLNLVKRIVETDHLGKLIYAGGDDVLAVVNLKDLAEVMVRLRAAFSGHVDKDMNPDFSKDVSGFVDMGDHFLMTMGPEASASTGIVIAHYKSPLAMVLDRAKQMEHKAKHLPGKNAFAICLMKHSGESTECAAKWFYENPSPKGTMEVLEKLADLIRTDVISNKFIYAIKEEFSKLVTTDGLLDIKSTILKNELSRLLKRSKKKKDDQSDTGISKLSERLYQIFHELERNMKYFISFLEISNFLAREVKRYDSD